MNKRAAFILIAVAGALLDFVTKEWAFRVLIPLGPHARIDVIPGWLGWRYSYNPGIVWGLFPNAPGLFTILSLVAVPLLVLFHWKTPSTKWIFTIGLGLILAGTLGNLCDRVLFGKVRDFIDVYVIHYPIFNVADSMICIGVGALAWHFTFGGKSADSREETPAPGSPADSPAPDAGRTDLP
jgi:signal peptidase II